MPRGRILLGALLIPVSYAPSFVLGSHPGPAGLAALALAFAIALLTAWTFERTRLLERFARPIDRRANLILAIALIAYVAFSTATSLHRLARFEHAPMIGLFGQSYWTQLRGFAFANTQESIDGTLGSHFAIHFSPALLILAPFYSLWPKPVVLVVAQAVVLALAMLPLAALLRPHAGRGVAALLSIALLLVPIFAFGAARDFHDSNFLPAPLLAATLAMERRGWPWFALFAALALGVREDAGLVLAALGVVALCRGLGWRAALAIAGSGLLWTVAVTRLVMPRFASAGMITDPQGFFVAMFGQWGATPLAAIRGILTRPAAVLHALTNRDAVRYVYLVLRPLLVLPPFGDWAALVALPGLAINLLSRYAFMRAAELPYTLVPSAFLTLAAMRSALRLASGESEQRRAGAGLAVALIVLAGTLPSLVLSLPRAEPRLPPRAAADALVRIIPPDAPIYAPLSLYPRLCNREDFDDWESTGPLALDAAFRRRYQMIVLWPGGDAPGVVRERTLADSLAGDPHFVRRPGFEPFIVYQRRALNPAGRN